ncbi:hypothetical protein [Thiothrix eikelboomii]|uniref:hypothetical protein n=1 Tax=Thiothrix eikelboomii TaxID=92487 RepID=UPI003BB08B1C
MKTVSLLEPLLILIIGWVAVLIVLAIYDANSKYATVHPLITDSYRLATGDFLEPVPLFTRT